MGCPCSNNNKLNDNNKLNNNKRLHLDDMKNMSIDKIVDLYRDGYILEGVENGYSIENLSYGTECSGTPTLDKSSIEENIADFIPFVMKIAYAQKFTPASKCLSSVTLKIRKVADVDATVTICSDSGGYPAFPSSKLGEFTRYYNELSYSFTEVNFPLNILLPNLNPIWIVINSMYDPNVTDATELINIASKYVASGNNLAFKSGNNAWIYVANGKPYFKTFKTTYTSPSNAQVFNACWGSGLGSTCSIPPERPVVPIGTNFPIKADIANSGTTGPVRAVFKIDSTTISDQNTPSLATYPGGGFWSPTVNYTMPSTDVTLSVEGYGWTGSTWTLTNTLSATISKSIPVCTGISLDANTVNANVGDTITLTAYGITPTTQPYTVTFTDRSNTVLGTCNSSNGMCSINWDTTGLTGGTYYVKAAVIGQCTSTELAIGLSIPIVQWNVDVYVKDSITTNPIQGASVTIGTQTLTTDVIGFRRFRVDEGTINVTITKTGYNTIGPDPQSVYNNTTLNYNMVPVSQNPGSLRFVTSPPGISGAAVHFVGDNPTLKGTTDANGLLTVPSLAAGRVVNYQVIKTGYNTTTGNATVVGNVTTDVIVTMTPVSTTGSVCIHSNPSGASIKIDNTTRTGKSTALSGGGCIGTNTIDNLSSGNHNYELSINGYQNKTGFFSITVGQTLDYDAGVLSPLPNLGTLNISSSPSGARIYIMSNSIYLDTGYVTGTSVSPTVITTLTAGAYNYKLTLVGYQDYVNTFNITTGQTTVVNPTLTISTPTTGSLSIASYPEGAEIYIEIGGTFEDMLHITGPIGNPTIISNLEEGSYRYKLTYPDYPDTIGSFTITAGQITGPINVTMTKTSADSGSGMIFGLLGIAALGMMLSSNTTPPRLTKKD